LKKTVFVFVLISLFFSSPTTATASGYTNVTVSEAKAMIDSKLSLVILDVRDLTEYYSGHIRNAKLIPVAELESRLNELNKTDEILVYCRAGGRSTTASQTLADNGFLHVYNMQGGILAWISAGYPVYVKYSSIQMAINAADPGDIIFVSSGTYYEKIVVDKSISLFGENRETTIIDGGGTGTVVHITVNNVVMREFTISNGGKSAYWESSVLLESQSCTISANTITGSFLGIVLLSAGKSKVVGNEVYDINGDYSIYISDSNETLVADNKVYSNIRGIVIDNSSDSVIIRNQIHNNSNFGVWFSAIHNFTFTKNNSSGNGVGINFEADSQDNLILENYFCENGIGIRLDNASNNLIYHNNFMNNSLQVETNGLINSWDDGYPSGGNYWSDYNGTDSYNGLYQNETGSDGIGDIPYVIDTSNEDSYPLIDPFPARMTKTGDMGGGLPPQFFNFDNMIDGKDLALFLQCYKGLAPAEAMHLADLGGGLPPQFFECDGKVDGKDLALFLQCFKGLGPDT